MLAPRRLWTGPPGTAIRDRLVEDLGAEPGTLWIAPTRLASDELERVLCRRSRGGGRPARVFCWDELWRAVRREAEDGPRWLSGTAARAVFLEAIGWAREAGLTTAVDGVLELGGYQRRLAARF